MLKRPVVGMMQFVPVIFSDLIIHAEMVESLLAGPLKGFTVHSAGFISPMLKQCYGRSESLGVASDEEQDTKRIQYADYCVFE
jgi:hypothetical protein